MPQELNEENLKKVLIPKLYEEIERNKGIEKYITLEGQMVPIPPRSSPEHRQIASHAKAPWASKIVSTRVNRLKVSGIKDAQGSNAEYWQRWKEWKMVQKQKATYRESCSYGVAFTELIKTGAASTMPLNKSPMSFTAFYGSDGFTDPLNADFPVMAIETNHKGLFKVWDDTTVSLWERSGGNSGLYLRKRELHGANVVPIVRYAHDLSSEGKSVGLIKPLIHILNRLMKAVYDSSLINHNNSWNIRYVAGLSAIADEEKLTDETDAEYDARLARMEAGMRQELGTSDLLISPDKDTKFGTLAATNPASFVTVIAEMIKELASLSDTPSNYLTGDVVGLSAEQSSNSQDNYNALIESLKDVFGESHEQLLNLHDHIVGKPSDPSRSVTWEERDTGSIAAQVDALGKSAQMLLIPEQELWEEYPNMTPEKLERWKIAAQEKANKEASFLNGLASIGNETATPAVLAKDVTLGGGV